jgi:RNA-directed DNA polymerase
VKVEREVQDRLHAAVSGVLAAPVPEVQRKLHEWASEDAEHRFRDPCNLVCDPARLVVAWSRVSQNRGSRMAGIDGKTALGS